MSRVSYAGDLVSNSAALQKDEIGQRDCAETASWPFEIRTAMASRTQWNVLNINQNLFTKVCQIYQKRIYLHKIQVFP